MIIVHHLNNSRSQRILWLLEELGLEYEVVKYLRDPATLRAPPELQSLHPLGKLPVIVDGALTLANPARSSIMCWSATARAGWCPPSPQGRHIGPGPGFVDEDEPLRIDAALIFLPLDPPPRDLWSIAFASRHAFF